MIKKLDLPTIPGWTTSTPFEQMLLAKLNELIKYCNELDKLREGE